MKKTFVLDTNVLLVSPESIFKFEDNDVVLPISVIEEIDTFKKEQSEMGRNAREVSRILDKMRKRGSLCDGVVIDEDREGSGKLSIMLPEFEHETLEQTTDNQILIVAMVLKERDNSRVVVVTKDSNLRIKADAYDIEAEDYESDKVDLSHFYTGIARVKVDAVQVNDFYLKQQISLPHADLKPNQFVIVEDSSTGQDIHGVYDYGQNLVNMLEYSYDNVWGIRPRNTEQIFALAALLNEDIKLVTLSGGAGTGKTLLAMAAGLTKTTDEDVYHKLLVARPVFPLGRDIGFLPGDLSEKLNPWMQPIFDNLELLLGGPALPRQKRLSKSYQELINQGLLQVEPLTYIRGRSLPNIYFVVDEAQNLTPHEVKTILTRAGEGTKIILTGDPYQIDNPYIDADNNGLTYAIEKFKNSKIAAHVTLSKDERSALATEAASIL